MAGTINTRNVAPRAELANPRTVAPEKSPAQSAPAVNTRMVGHVDTFEAPRTKALPSAKPTATGVPAPAGQRPNPTNHGGALLDKPVVSNIYLGSYWNTTAGKADKAHNDAFTQEVGTSGFQNVAKQYGAGGPTFGGSTVVNVTNPKKVTEADVQKLVLQQLKAGTVKPNAQGLYNVVLPPNTVLDAGGGVTSKNGLGGFHGSVAGPDGKPVYYSVIAYSKGSNGIDFTRGNAQDNISITESHEWFEAVTDPDVNSTIPGHDKLGWYDEANNGEISDLTMTMLPLSKAWQKDAKGFAQQLEWSNKDQLFEIDAKKAAALKEAA